MSKQTIIPVHRMEDWFAGIYLKRMRSDVVPELHYERSVPHRHDFYYCVLIDQGTIELKVDLECVKLSDNNLFFSYPGQVHQIDSMQVKSGWFLAFDPAIIDETLRNILDQFLTDIVLLEMAPEVVRMLCSALDQIKTIYQDKTLLFRQQTLLPLITSFIYRLASAYLSVEGFKLSKHSHRHIEITKRFTQILRHRYRTMKRPAEFAAELNITVSHLNDTIRSVTGMPVTHHIQQKVMKEAQRLLCYSDLSIKEISDLLGFDDAKYFNRLFSQVIGCSPGSFRKTPEIKNL